MVWELVFFLLILKIPVIYVCAVIWYAIKAEPELETGDAGATDELSPRPWRPWHSWRSPDRPRPRRGGPHGSPARTYARTAHPATAHSEVKR